MTKVLKVLMVNMFITIGLNFSEAKAQTPGGVANGLILWLQPQDFTGANWTDSSPLNNDYVQGVANRRPSLSAGLTNYNQTVRFDDGDGQRDYMDGNDLLLNGDNSFAIFGSVQNMGSGNFSPIIELNPNAFARFEIATGVGTRLILPSFGTVSSPIDNSGNHVVLSATSDGTNVSAYLNGQFGNASAINLQKPDAGSRIGSAGRGPLRANVGDLIVYDENLTAVQQTQVETYVAIKYGITLRNVGGGTEGDYISTNNSTVWDASQNAAFQNDVIGIARDDAEALNQKQSHAADDATRIYMNALAVSNAANTGTFIADNSYVLVGHNNGDVCNTAASSVEIPTGIVGCPVYARLEREWKLTKTNFSQDFNLDVTLSPCGIPGAVNPANLALLVDDDGDFSNGGTTCFYNGDGSGIVISYTNPQITLSNLNNAHFPDNNSQYWTIASLNSTTPLPVELADYGLECKDGRTTLYWATVSESDNDKFIIERSRDLQHFELVGTVNGKGNSTEFSEYTWTDNSVTAGDLYYRLSQVDNNGSVEIFDVISANCGEEPSLLIYPNPFDEVMNVHSIYGGTLVVTDKLGRIVCQEKLSSGETRIPINSMVPGLYFASLYMENGECTVQRIMKK